MRGTWGTVYPETKSILLKLYPCGANPRVVVIGVQGIPKLNQILLKSYPCGDDPCVVAKGVQVIPKLNQNFTEIIPLWG